jgi:hypothetical protein
MSPASPIVTGEIVHRLRSMRRWWQAAGVCRPLSGVHPGACTGSLHFQSTRTSSQRSQWYDTVNRSHHSTAIGIVRIRVCDETYEPTSCDVRERNLKASYVSVGPSQKMRICGRLEEFLQVLTPLFNVKTYEPRFTHGSALTELMKRPTVRQKLNF